MKKNQETGHAKNVANMDLFKKYCTSLGIEFNPSRVELQLPQLSQLVTSCKTCLKVVKDNKATYHFATNEREVAFLPMAKLVTKILAAVTATGATTQTLNDVRGLIRKIKGRRAKPLPKQPTATNIDQANAATAKNKSVSQQGFDNRIDHLEQLIAILATLPKYKPNEQELTVNGLTRYLEDLQIKNNAASDAETALNNARISRNEVMYGEKNSLIEVAAALKSYIKSVYGALSPQSRRANSFTFTKISEA
jgi:hypothetical protein